MRSLANLARAAAAERRAQPAAIIARADQQHALVLAGRRTLPLPKFAIDMLRQRRTLPYLGEQKMIFPSTAGTLRDPDNFAKLWRTARDELGVPDVRTHTFRKTVATLIDDEGMSARIGADHLGHAKISMTQDVYMARGRMHTQVAELLDRTVQQTAPPGCLDSARNCRPNSVAPHGVTVQNMREQGESGG
jgi:integrase